jgi:IS605 OrfB family transposase
MDSKGHPRLLTPKDAAGRYFASFVVESEPETLPQVTPEVGIDLGLGHFAVLSDGRKIDAPRCLRRAEKKLKREQRRLARKAKGSNNRDKARIKVARAHAQAADARREFHHQLSTQIIRENQAIAVEDLAVKGLARTRLAKSVHDAGWSAFVAMLEYKAARYGRRFFRIGRFEPTSQVCSACSPGRPQAPAHPRMDMQGQRNRPGQRHQRGGRHRQGRRAGGVSLWSAGKTGTPPGTARRNRDPPRRSIDRGRNPRPLGPGAEVNRTGRSSPQRECPGSAARTSPACSRRPRSPCRAPPGSMER